MPMRKKILVVTGPQGSGNHCWSKIFSHHPEVCGWRELTKQYWIGHDKEPLYKCWHYPSLLYKLSWDKEYYFTNMSVPFGGHVLENKKIPKVKKFIDTLIDLDFDVQVAITSRDKNILEIQQTRRWTHPTTFEFMDIIDDIKDPIFLSYESLQLYGERYVRSLGIKIPIDFTKIRDIIMTDANMKYIS